MRAGLRAVLSENPGLRVVAEANDTQTAAALVGGHLPDVVLLTEPADTGALLLIRRALPTGCILCLDERGDLRAADVLCVPPDAGIDDLCSAMGVALNGRCGGCAFRVQCHAPRVAVALSRRERQVAVAVSEGKSSKQIAAALGIALRTVNTYRESLARKIGASSGAIVTRFVLENELTAP